MIHLKLINIFRKGSRTYFTASAMFPPKVLQKVIVLYAFVRQADDLVDSIPAREKEFFVFKQNVTKAFDGQKTGDVVIDSFFELKKEVGFEDMWIKEFMASMEEDLTNNKKESLNETKKYIHGSAEVVGLMMARILDLPQKANHFAKKLGEAMQWANFIRDIKEDNDLGRIYFPLSELKRFNLPDLQTKTALNNKNSFYKFINFQIDRYFQLVKDAEIGFSYISKKHLVPIKTATDMYNFTMTKIKKDPLIVYKKKIKPSRIRILKQSVCNYFTL